MPAAETPVPRGRRGGTSSTPATLAVVLALLLIAVGGYFLDAALNRSTETDAATRANGRDVAAAASPLDAPDPAASPAALPPPEPAAVPVSPPPSDPSPSATARRSTPPQAVAVQPKPRRQGAVRLTVPALGIDRDALPLGTAADGSLDVPATAQDVGFYTDRAVPGDEGPAVLAGHVDLDGKPGVFSRLATMAPGQEISVTRPDGATVRFVVRRVEQYAKTAFPTDEVYGPTEVPALRLITCGGSFDKRRGSYRDNVVVYAVLA